MSIRFTGVGLFLAACALVAPASGASTAPSEQLAHGDAKRTASKLRDAVERHVSDAGLKQSLRDYRLDPSVVQLRRYVDGRKKKLVCVIDLALSDKQGALLGSVRGNATTLGAATEDEALDAAAQSAVTLLPQMLKATTPKT